MAVGIADAQHAGRARRVVRRVRGIASTVSKRYYYYYYTVSTRRAVQA